MATMQVKYVPLPLDTFDAHGITKVLMSKKTKVLSITDVDGVPTLLVLTDPNDYFEHRRFFYATAGELFQDGPTVAYIGPWSRHTPAAIDDVLFFFDAGPDPVAGLSGESFDVNTKVKTL